MLSITIFSMVMMIVMSSVQSMMAGRIKSMNRIALTDELYFFSEQLFVLIKGGGTLDYEEYWNRYAVEAGEKNNPDYLANLQKNGHYEKPTGVWNYGANGTLPVAGVRAGKIQSEVANLGGNLYFCASESVTSYIDGNGCLETLNSQNTSQVWKYQRFGQYAQQFWDYNSNRDNKDDGADDDRNLYRGPVAVLEDGNPRELYLYNSQDQTRTFIRWKKIQDPNAKGNCENDENSCLGTIQILKLQWYDRGQEHTGEIDTSVNVGAFDGKIDTWVCAKGWNCMGPEISEWRLATGRDEEWVNLFPNSINVRNFGLNVFPLRDPWLAVAEVDCNNDTNCLSPFIHPYVRMNLELGFSHGKRRGLRNENPIISLPVTISLDDFR